LEYKRIKTGMQYTTFSTPESLTAIINYLIKYPPINIESPLFRTDRTNNPTKPNTFASYFYRLNITCNFGKPDRFSFLRSHAMRKYLATTLYKIGLPQLSIDWLLGHKIDKTTNAYFKNDISKLKEQNITCIPDLSIEDVEVHTLQSPEFKKVTEELKASELRLQRLERYIEEKDKIDQIKKPE
jgi:hypothetical protein